MSASYEGATEIVGGAGIPSDGSPFLVAQIDVCGQPVPSAPIGIAGAVAFVDLLGQVCQLTAVRDEIGIAFCTTAAGEGGGGNAIPGRGHALRGKRGGLKAAETEQQSCNKRVRRG